VGFVKSAAKKSLLALTKKGELTPRFWARFFEAFVTKDELISFSDSGAVDHGLLSGLTDDDHSIYYNAARHTALSHSFVDHDDLTNAGTNTHSQIDTHIGTSSIHFTEGSIDHTAISNIGTNTHAQIDTFIGTTVPDTYLPLTAGVLKPLTGTLHLDTISYNDDGSGDVTIDSDIGITGILSVDSIQPYTGGSPVTIGSSLFINGPVEIDHGISTGIISISSAVSFTPDETYSTLLCDATSNTITILLPSTGDVREGIIFTIKVINANNTVTVTPDGLEEINGSNSSITLALNESITIQSDGSNWWGIPDSKFIDYSYVSSNDASTDVTGAELEELSDGSDTALHDHDTMYYTKTETVSVISIFADGTSGTVTVTLPPAATVTGYVYNVKAINIDNAVTLATFGSEEIDGSSTDITLYLMEVITAQSDGSNWWII